MKKILLKRYSLLILLSVFSISFISCNRDGELEDPESKKDKITAEGVILGTSEVKIVKIKVTAPDLSEVVITETPFVNNGFTFELPKKLDDNLLLGINELMDEELGDMIQMSDKNARANVSTAIHGYDDAGESKGLFFYMSGQVFKNYLTQWIYADRDFTVKGSGELSVEDVDISFRFDLNLKKGWNTIYTENDVEYDFVTGETAANIDVSSVKPKNVNFSWRFMDSFSPIALTKDFGFLTLK